MSRAAAIVWLDRDLRLADNPALHAAVERGFAVVPVFVWAPEEEGRWAPGGASRWWLHQSLEQLGSTLEGAGSKLVVRRGPTSDTLLKLSAETGARHVFWNRRYEPAARARNQAVKSSLRAGGVSPEVFEGNVLFEPGTVMNKSGGPFQVFTAFWRACQAEELPAKPKPAPDHFAAPPHWPESLSVDALELEPKIDWAGGLRSAWQPGEAGAEVRLGHFLEGAVEDYPEQRDFPSRKATSGLSPHLAFGEISARQIFHQAREVSGSESYVRQIFWREFSYHLMHHFPETPEQPLRSEFRFFPWRMSETSLRAWSRGRTGYPLIDAGMRQLWHTGWMHNRVRMAVASFLVKHLLVPWQEGAAWFWDTLVDADLANNTMGWQWTAGCGADAAPYFRVFNPILQSKKFDSTGSYIRRWVPELSGLPEEWIHEPWTAPAMVLAQSGIVLGEDYPLPIIEHGEGRDRALAALEELKRN